MNKTPDEIVNDIKKIPAKKITKFGPSKLHAILGETKAYDATRAISQMACVTFAQAVKNSAPDLEGNVDSFYCPNNDTIVVHYNGQFFDSDLTMSGSIEFYSNLDESTLNAYKQCLAAIRAEQARTDPSKVGMFEQKANPDFKN